MQQERRMSLVANLAAIPRVAVGSMIGGGVLVTCLLFSAVPSQAAGSDDGFAAFWTQFKVAVGKGDQNAVSRMVKYPIDYAAVGKAADFPLLWKDAFRPAQRKCLAKQKPVRDTDRDGKVNYYATCYSLIYAFGKHDGGWKLIYLTEND